MVSMKFFSSCLAGEGRGGGSVPLFSLAEQGQTEATVPLQAAMLAGQELQEEQTHVGNKCLNYIHDRFCPSLQH